MMDEDMDFKVETWSARGGIERLLARTATVFVGRGAFAAAVESYPQKNITLRQGARVLKEHRAEASSGHAQ